MKINNKGFTLIEMLVVVAIIGLLSAVVVVGLTGAREKARDSRRVADLREIQNQLELDYMSTEGYPTNSNQTDIQDYLDASGGNFPTDPQGVEYKYAGVDSGGDGFNESYELGTCVESMDNISAESASCGNLSSCTTGTLFCVTPN